VPQRSVVIIAACRVATRMCRACSAAGEAAPRPYNVGNPPPVGDKGITVMRDPPVL